VHISGDGIASYMVRIKPNFKVDTRLALNWIQASNGQYKATDRGYTSDIYEAEFTIRAKEEEVNNFIDAVHDNREAETNYFQLSGFESTEHIFGEDVDYSSPIDVTVLEVSGVKQPFWKTREIKVKTRALSPNFTGSPSLPSLNCLGIGYETKTDRTITKYDSYYGDFSYLDRESDVGVFVGTFMFTIDEMRAIRRYIATQRDATISIPSIGGVEYPFGPYRPNTYPISVKIIDWEDLGMWGVHDWRIKLTMAEVI